MISHKINSAPQSCVKLHSCVKLQSCVELQSFYNEPQSCIKPQTCIEPQSCVELVCFLLSGVYSLWALYELIVLSAHLLNTCLSQIVTKQGTFHMTNSY